MLLISCAKAADLEFTQDPVTSEVTENSETLSDSEPISPIKIEAKKPEITVEETTIKQEDNSATDNHHSESETGDEEQNLQEATVPQDVWCSALWGIYQEYFSVAYTPKLDHNNDNQVGAIDFTIFASYYRTKHLESSQQWCHEQIMK